MFKKIKEKLNKQMGQTFIEYILISALIGLVLVGVSGELIKGAKTNFYYGLLPTNEQKIDLPAPPEGVPPVGAKPPTAIINGPNVIHIGDTVTFTDNSTDSDGRIVRTSWGSSTVQKQYIEEGNFSITLTVWDNDGLTDTTTFEFIVENKAPIAVIETSPSNSILWKEEMSVSAIKSSDPDNDKITDWQWYLDGQEIDWPYDAHTQKFQEGSHTIGLKVMDIFGKWSSLTTTPIEIKSNSKPIAVINYTPKNNVNDKTNINWNSNSSYDPDADKIVSVEWKVDDIVKNNPNGQLSTGSHTVSLRVQDEWGLWSDWVETIIDIESSNQPPIAVITVTPEQGPYYINTIFTWDYKNSTDPDGDQIVDAEWSNKQETYAIGTYTIGLRVKDSKGLWSEWVYKTITIQDFIWSTFNFTNAGAIGAYGPSQTQLNSAYVGSSLEAKVTSSNGIQIWIVPYTGNYRIEVYGAQGGNTWSGKGAIMKGDFYLNKGEKLKILVGQQGVGMGKTGSYNDSASGGGGSFVTKIDNTPLIIAGGGGGYTVDSGQDAVTTTNGVNGASTYGGKGGINGGGGGAGRNGAAGTISMDGGTGSSCSYGPGGGGFYTNGGNNCNNSNSNSGGRSFVNGGTGGINGDGNQLDGGFGGGGASGHRGGGGGGYSGGGGGGSLAPGGGGGGSYNLGTNQSNSVGNTGNGKVIIKYNVQSLDTTFNYIGNYETWIVPATGKYQIELWGAEGGASAVAGGKGGYVYGETTLTAGTTLYLYVGQKGINTSNTNGGSGGWNGGGNGSSGSTWWGGGGGGGATDIRMGGTALSNRIIVAGGGGGTSGSAPGQTGGSGGGWTGSTGAGNNAGTGGTQSQGGSPDGSLGFGGNGRWTGCDGGAGGGGGYYGGGSGIGICGTDGGAGGGSSYTSPIFSNTNTQSGIRTGDGSIRIKYIGN